MIRWVMILIIATTIAVGALLSPTEAESTCASQVWNFTGVAYCGAWYQCVYPVQGLFRQQRLYTCSNGICYPTSTYRYVVACSCYAG